MIKHIWIKADNGKLSKVLEFDSGKTVSIPINRDGSVKWMEEPIKKEEGQVV